MPLYRQHQKLAHNGKMKKGWLWLIYGGKQGRDCVLYGASAHTLMMK
jgi:hypothetical protein